MSTSSPSWIFKSPVTVMRVLLCISEDRSPRTSAKGGNEGFDIQDGEDVNVLRSPDREVTDGHSISAREEKMQKVKSELCSTSACDYFECPTFLKIVLSFPGEVCRQVHRDHYPYRPSISGHCRRHPRKLFHNDRFTTSIAEIYKAKKVTKGQFHYALLCLPSIKSRVY